MIKLLKAFWLVLLSLPPDPSLLSSLTLAVFVTEGMEKESTARLRERWEEMTRKERILWHRQPTVMNEEMELSRFLDFRSVDRARDDERRAKRGEGSSR